MASTKDASSPTGGSARSDSPTTAPKTSATPPLDIDVHEEPVEVDEQDDKDSSYAESVSSESYFTSLRSSIRDYKYENGRRYHAFREGAYPLPNDEEEQDRLDLLHHGYLLLLDGVLHRAPLPPKLDRVLDLGTGTGLWAVHFADDHPEAEVVGTDLSPIQPVWVPPNCSFEIDDFEANWVYSRPFDYIHARELNGSMSDPKRLCQQAYRALKPGGWIEFQMGSGLIFSDDGTHVRAKRTLEWFDIVCNAAERFGKPIRITHQMKEYLTDEGFVDIGQYIAKVPLHTWPKNPKLKHIGRLEEVHMLQMYDSYTPGFFGRLLGWEKGPTDALLADCRKELFDRSVHAYLMVYFVWGRKPD